MESTEGILDKIISFLSHPLFALFVALLLAWLAWVGGTRPSVKSKKALEHYIDDSKIRKIEAYELTFNWSMWYFLFKNCKLMDIPAPSDVSVHYVPQGGEEEELSTDYFDDTPIKNKVYRPLKLKSKRFSRHNFFRRNAIEKVTVIVETPLERNKYAEKVKKDWNGNMLSIWNENSEELRNFEYLLDKPCRLKNIKVIQGVIKGINLSVPYPQSSPFLRQMIGNVDTDVAMSLILDFPAKRINGLDIVKVQLC